ncbi:MAG TPA: hypothetical protein PLP19_08060 [bacterium]|nr:hypothetical protein [bacterium]HPN43426.1 hypothetical protein [bacterium]
MSIRTCRYFKYLLTVLFVLSLYSQNVCAGIIKGVVVNGSRQEKPLANIPVLLQKIGSNDTVHVDVTKTTSNRVGQFEFVTEFSDSTASYFAAVDYQGARYYSRSNDPEMQKIVVYDSTHNLQNISAIMHHVIISQVGEMLKIKETRIIHNPDSLAIPCSSLDEAENDPVIFFALPEGYRNIRQVSMSFGNTLVTGGNNLFFIGVIHPGNNPVSYTYEMPFDAHSATINLPINLSTQSLDVFSSDPALKIESAQLHDEGPFTIRGNQYQRFNARDLAAGSMMTMTVSHSVDHRPRFIIVGLLVVAIALFSVINYLFRRGKRRNRQAAADPITRLQERRRELIDAIATLDSREGRPDKKSQTRRRQLFDELQDIELSLQESNSSRDEQA